jgi:hypothetical protein
MAPILGIYASQISGHLFAPSGAYDSIATVTVGSGGSSSISFTSIPATYTHLQIRGISKMSSGASLYMQLNSDTGSNYARHYLNGNGSTTGAGANSSFTNMFAGTTANATSTFGASIIDILGTQQQLLPSLLQVIATLTSTHSLPYTG